ncbi:hypothetical protein Tco_1062279, partial [Tanacetum coccineum]
RDGEDGGDAVVMFRGMGGWWWCAWRDGDGGCHGDAGDKKSMDEILSILDSIAHPVSQASNSPEKNMLKSVNIKVGEFIDCDGEDGGDDVVMFRGMGGWWWCAWRDGDGGCHGDAGDKVMMVE